MRFASRSLATTLKASPALATSCRPSATTGVDGPASWIRAPAKSVIALIRPQVRPTSTASPWRSRPRCTSSVVRGPCRRSSSASITTPAAARSGFAWKLLMSASRPTVSSRSSSPSPRVAETGTSGTSPPYSSICTPASASEALTRSGLTLSRSILFSATTIGTSAAWMWLIASRVCGITPSLAATTRTAISVALAPRARISVNASWPGVSMKVSSRPPASV